MSDEHDGTHEADETEPAAPASGAEVTEPIAPVAEGPAVTEPPPPPQVPPHAAVSGWSRPSGVPVLTLTLGALLIGVLAFGVGVFAGRASEDASGRDGRGWMWAGGDRGGMMPGGAMAPGMPGGMMPGNGSGSFPGMPGVGAGGSGSLPGNWVVTAGTVTGVEGDTIVVQSVRGNSVTVHTSDATSIRIVRDQGQTDDGIAEGDDIMVTGTPGDADLTIEAVHVVAGDLPWIRSIGEVGSASGGSTGATTAS